jgi:hypothetical protein
VYDVRLRPGIGIHPHLAPDADSFNWQTPRKPRNCYNVTVQMVDGTQIPVAKLWLQ